MRRFVLSAVLILIASAMFAAETDDLVAARRIFDENLDAIRHQDRDAYLATYLHDPRFAVTTSAGLEKGFEGFAKQKSSWPDAFDAEQLELTPVAPGVVYGTYRYRVRYGADEHQGISERLFVETPGGWKIALTGANDTPPGVPPPPRAIVGGTLIDGRGGAPVPNANVVLRNGKIDCAGTAEQCPVPEGIEVTDAAGRWITPGLIDAHVHFSQSGWADGRPDSLDVRAKYPYAGVEADLAAHPERFGRSYVCSGVTSVFDVGGYPWTLRLHDRFENDTLAPHVVAAGPLLSTIDHWLNLPAERQFVFLTSEEAARNGVDYLKARGSKAIKVWYIVTPEATVERSAPYVRAAGEEARKAGLPLIVHATGLAEAKEALRDGAKVLVHSVSDQPVDQDFLDLAKKNGTILIPTLTVMDGYLRMYESLLDRKPPVVDDPNHCIDAATLAKVASTATLDPSLMKGNLGARVQRTEKLDRTAAENLATLVRAGIPIATGTDAGNPLTLHGPAIYAEMDAMQSAGMTPMQVIVSSTEIGSRATGLENETGTIEKGKDADLLILGADPSKNVSNFRRIVDVVRGGELRSIRDLSAIASE
ncbi:MAG: amidohydrolase family protein [Thermoanaerobaculia bacterium]